MTPTEQCNRDVQDIINGAGTGLHAAILAYGRACAVEAWQLGRASASAVPEKPAKPDYLRQWADESMAGWRRDRPETLR